MASQKETEEDFIPSVSGLPPLESSIRTFLGRDEGGPIYTRLEYEPVVNQVQLHAPNVIKGLVRRLETTHPDYIARLNAAVTERFNAPAPEKNDAADSDEKQKRPPSEYQLELRDQLTQATAVRDFVGSLVTKSMLNQQTRQPSEQKLRHQLNVAANIYAEDPLIQLSQEAAAIFRRDEYDHLARFTIGAAVAVVEYSGIYAAEEIRAEPTNNATPAA
jgi:hypothetical protein